MTSFSDTLAILSDRRFANLHRIVDDHPLTFDEFKALPMPEGLTHRQTWELLNTVRSHLSIELPFRDSTGARGWFYPTRSLLRDLEDLEKRCQPNGPLDQTIQYRSVLGFTIEAFVGEWTSEADEDGYPLSYEDARDVLLGYRLADSPEERLVQNAGELSRSLDALVDVPVTADMLVELSLRLLEGVELRPAPSPNNDGPWKSEFDSRTALKIACRIINGARSTAFEHPVLLASGLRTVFQGSQPLRSGNMTFTSLLMKLLLKKAQLPVLASVPINMMLREWHEGTIAPPKVAVPVEESWNEVNGEFDYTLHATAAVQLVRRGLDKLEQDLMRSVSRDAELDQAFSADLELNARQRDVLRAALANPKAVFRIRPHQRQYRMAYATARSDLLDLASMGLLQMSKSGRAFEFRAVPDLRKVLAGRCA